MDGKIICLVLDFAEIFYKLGLVDSQWDGNLAVVQKDFDACLLGYWRAYESR